jgi:hypothetical protein
MTATIALLLALAPVDGPAATDVPRDMRLDDPVPDSEAFVRFRGGGWASSGFEFRAELPGSLLARSDGQAMWSVGLDAGVVFAGHYVFFATVEHSLTDDVNADVAGLCFGYREVAPRGAPAGVPDEVTLYAGGIWGRFEIDASGFDDFDDGLGLRAGLAFTWRPAFGFAVSAIVEYRLIEFEYQGEVVDGDKEAGGSTVWAGVGVDFRF